MNICERMIAAVGQRASIGPLTQDFPTPMISIPCKPEMEYPVYGVDEIMVNVHTKLRSTSHLVAIYETQAVQAPRFGRLSEQL